MNFFLTNVSALQKSQEQYKGPKYLERTKLEDTAMLFDSGTFYIKRYGW